MLTLLGFCTSVNSQVHQSSKGSGSFQRLRSVGVGTFIYASDYDDFLPPANRGGKNGAVWGYGRPDVVWYELVEPYVGGFSYTVSPFDPLPLEARHLDTVTGQPLPPDDPDYWYAVAARSNIGMNLDFFSPWFYDSQTGISSSRPIWLSRIERPGRTLMLVSSVWDRDQNGVPVGGGSWAVSSPCVRDSQGQLLEPMKSLGSSWFSQGGWRPLSKSWLEYGGAWPWYENRLFHYMTSDGSILTASPTELAEGCDVKLGQGGYAYDEGAYLWDLR